MLTGIKFSCTPSSDQKRILSQWMGCARFIWNAKCDEDRYLRSFARRYLPVGTYAPVNATFSQYKTELSPWLKDCPSQILRNSATNWYRTYQSFLKGRCGRPRHKPKSDRGSIYLTRELFRFEKTPGGHLRLKIGTKTRDLGELNVRFHRAFNIPNSLYIRRERGRYTVSFCYEDGQGDQKSLAEHLRALNAQDVNDLEQLTCGIDRGVAAPVQTSMRMDPYTLTDNQRRNKARHERAIKRLQRRLSRQRKGSNRRDRTKRRLANHHADRANIRRDFCHKASRDLVDGTATVFVLEDLNTRHMTRSAKGTLENPGKRVKQKSGLNRSILDQGWHQFAQYLTYKAYRAGKAVFKIAPHHTSQECAECGHIHPGNRTTQSAFSCVSCGHTDNADRNASRVIAKRAIKLIQDSGTELSSDGMLSPPRIQGVEPGHRTAASRAAKRQKRQQVAQAA